MPYPADLSVYVAKTGADVIASAHVNALQTDVVNTQTELGTDPAGSMTDVKSRLAVSLAADGDLAFVAVSTLTIAAGAVTATGNRHLIDTQGAAATDDLDTINGGAAGMVVDIRIVASARNVVITNAGNIVTPFGISHTLDTTAQSALLIYDSGLSKWRCYPNNITSWGDSANNATFESDGTLKFTGTATVWNDINFEGWQLGAAASAPDPVTLFGAGSIPGYGFDGNATTEQLSGGGEILHEYKEGTDIYVHAHWMPTTAAAGNVKWQLEYTWANVNGVFAAPTTIFIVQAAAGVAWTHQLAGFAAISGADKDIGSHFVFRFFRIPDDAADTYAADAVLLSIGIHYEQDTVGSRTTSAK